METKPKKKRKKHTEEFKREAVRLLEGRGERTVADVAGSLGVAENLLHLWKRKYGSAAEQVRKERGGETAEEELKRFRRKVTQLAEIRAIHTENEAAMAARDCSTNFATAPGGTSICGCASPGTGKIVTTSADSVGLCRQVDITAHTRRRRANHVPSMCRDLAPGGRSQWNALAPPRLKSLLIRANSAQTSTF